MFITKRRHQEILKLHEISAFQQQAIYEHHVEALKEQISDLRKLVFPTNVASEIPKEARELDAVISGSEKPPELSESELSKMLAGAREMDLIMSGNYDTDLGDA